MAPLPSGIASQKRTVGSLALALQGVILSLTGRMKTLLALFDISYFERLSSRKNDTHVHAANACRLSVERIAITGTRDFILIDARYIEVGV